MKRSVVAAVLFFTLLTGCGPAPCPMQPLPRVEQEAVKMRHQILFSHRGETHVFEGYMLLWGDALLVRAFAGPGVDLFTVVRNGEQHREELHIQGLEKQMDMAAIGADIARVYLGSCRGRATSGQGECELFGEKMVEIYRDDNTLAARRFPDAYGVGLKIHYGEYTERSGRRVPARIHLAWGNGETRMEIRLLAYEVLGEIDPALFEVVGPVD